MTKFRPRRSHWTEQDLKHIDGCIGHKLKNQRLILGITQKELGETVGVSPQQIQKYENATNRVAASTLLAFMDSLKTEISHFYRGINLGHEAVDTGIESEVSHEEHKYALAENPQQPLIYGVGEKAFPEREIIKLVLAYRKIKDPDARRQLLKFVESMVA